MRFRLQEPLHAQPPLVVQYDIRIKLVREISQFRMIIDGISVSEQPKRVRSQASQVAAEHFNRGASKVFFGQLFQGWTRARERFKFNRVQSRNRFRT